VRRSSRSTAFFLVRRSAWNPFFGRSRVPPPQPASSSRTIFGALKQRTLPCREERTVFSLVRRSAWNHSSDAPASHLPAGILLAHHLRCVEAAHPTLQGRTHRLFPGSTLCVEPALRTLPRPTPPAGILHAHHLRCVEAAHPTLQGRTHRLFPGSTLCMEPLFGRSRVSPPSRHPPRAQQNEPSPP
jgi:hypothetical protein